MILHSINKIDVMADCVNCLDNDDIIVLIEKAANTQALTTLNKLITTDKHIQIFVLTDSAPTDNNLDSTVTAITYRQFVSLCIEAEKTVSWH